MLLPVMISAKNITCKLKYLIANHMNYMQKLIYYLLFFFLLLLKMVHLEPKALEWFWSHVEEVECFVFCPAAGATRWKCYKAMSWWSVESWSLAHILLIHEHRFHTCACGSLGRANNGKALNLRSPSCTTAQSW